MKENQAMHSVDHKIVYLDDYQPPAFLVKHLDLTIAIEPEQAHVRAHIQLFRNPAVNSKEPLVLMGQDQTILGVKLNQRALAHEEWTSDAESLTVFEVPDSFTLEVISTHHPDKNTTLNGLYESSGSYYTQCEPQGFRKITYYLDRPDVLAPMTTTLVADRDKHPVLLSNGDKVGSGEGMEGQHWVTFRDPHPKPCYLFAMVAAKLDVLKDTYTTLSGRTIELEFYVQPEHIDQSRYALGALKRAMRWDETTFGLEYDLDSYKVVAVSDFNMGAMENKGLNIFNTKYVLADPRTATDDDFINVEAVIGHEYFHNWSGNRVTCRDWFQLSLKEGLTVFREQWFSGDMGSAALNRISDVNLLRTRQFSEDSGPMSHPVRPSSYIEINNFYTMTVYEKGSEVIRMMHTILGDAGFKKGLALYFKRHDGQAVTCDDFVQAMTDANQVDLTQFKRWYSQAGTPIVQFAGTWNKEAKTWTLSCHQEKPVTLAHTSQEPYTIPVRISLLASDGKAIELKSSSPKFKSTMIGEGLFMLDAPSSTLIFEGINEEPLPVFFAGFSAPVKWTYAYAVPQLEVLAIHATDAFVRWDSATQLYVMAVKELMNASGPAVDAVRRMVHALLSQTKDDEALVAALLRVPSFSFLEQQFTSVDIDALASARESLCESLAKVFGEKFIEAFHAHSETVGADFHSGIARGRRALISSVLSYIALTDQLDLVKSYYYSSAHMTGKIAALEALNQRPSASLDECLDAFYEEFKSYPLVVDKWLSLQARAPRVSTVSRIEALLQHPAYDKLNPNKIYALLSSFGIGNPVAFHQKDGKGYQLLVNQIIWLNDRNPQVAARLVTAFTPWRRFDAHRAHLMKQALQQLLSYSLSNDVYEIVSKTLNAT